MQHWVSWKSFTILNICYLIRPQNEFSRSVFPRNVLTWLNHICCTHVHFSFIVRTRKAYQIPNFYQLKMLFPTSSVHRLAFIVRSRLQETNRNGKQEKCRVFGCKYVVSSFKWHIQKQRRDFSPNYIWKFAIFWICQNHKKLVKLLRIWFHHHRPYFIIIIICCDYYLLFPRYFIPGCSCPEFYHHRSTSLFPDRCSGTAIVCVEKNVLPFHSSTITKLCKGSCIIQYQTWNLISIGKGSSSDSSNSTSSNSSTISILNWSTRFEKLSF